MPASEFKRWQIYEELEPFGDRLVGATLASIHRAEGDPPVQPLEFWTALAEDRRRVSQLLAMQNALLGAK